MEWKLNWKLIRSFSQWVRTLLVNGFHRRSSVGLEERRVRADSSMRKVLFRNLWKQFMNSIKLTILIIIDKSIWYHNSFIYKIVFLLLLPGLCNLSKSLISLHSLPLNLQISRADLSTNSSVTHDVLDGFLSFLSHSAQRQRSRCDTEYPVFSVVILLINNTGFSGIGFEFPTICFNVETTLVPFFTFMVDVFFFFQKMYCGT